MLANLWPCLLRRSRSFEHTPQPSPPSAPSLLLSLLPIHLPAVFVTDEGRRGGRTLPLKAIANAACAGLEALVRSVFVFKRTGADVTEGWVAGRDVWMDEVDSAFYLSAELPTNKASFFLATRLSCNVFSFPSISKISLDFPLLPWKK